MPATMENHLDPDATESGDSLTIQLLNLSDRLQMIESVASVLADALVSDTFEPTAEHGTRVLHHCVCGPLRKEVENISSWVRQRAATRKPDI